MARSETVVPLGNMPVSVSEALPALAFGIYALCAVATGMAMLGRLAAYGAVRQNFLLVAGLIAAMLCILAVPLFLGWILRWADRLWFGVMAGIALMLLFIAPRYKVAGASDQGDCIVVAAGRLASGLWPYDAASLWSQNPLSCGPGWVMLHMPFLVVLSYTQVMLALIGLSLAAIVACAGWRRTGRFVLLLALVPGFWHGLGNRTDLPVFAIVLAALAAAVQGDRPQLWPVGVMVIPVAVLVAHFRLPFLFLPAVLLAGRTPRALLLAAVAQGATFLLWLAFYAYDPVSFVRDGPMHVVGKFTALVGPQEALVLMTLGAALAVLLSAAIKRHVPLDYLLVFYVAVVVIPISAGSLLSVLATHGTVLGALREWEGLSWLTGAGCFAAWVVSSSEMSRRLWLADVRSG